MQALVEFSWQARLRDITEITVNVEFSADPDLSETFYIGNRTIESQQTIDVS